MTRNRIPLATVAAAVLALAAPAVAAAKDVNHDHLPDGWERSHGLSLKVNQAARDQDHDGLVNLLEYADHTNPRSADSNHNGVKDGQEDSDHDGVVNGKDQHPGQDDGSSEDGSGDGSEPSQPRAAFDHVVSLQGGVLTIARTDGSTVAATVAGDTDVECGVQLPGPFQRCGQELLVAGAKVGAAMHEPHDGTDTWQHVFLVGVGGSAPPPSPAPAQTAAPAATGTVASFDTGTGVLVVSRPSGEQPSGPLAAGATVRCLTISGGLVVAAAACDPATALVPGAVLGQSRRTLIGGVWWWTTIDVLVPATV